MVTMIRGGLITLIYSKSLRLDATATKDASAATLISTDIQSIVTGCTNIHEFWAAPIEVALAIYLLKCRIGVACAAPVVIAIMSALGSARIATLVHRRQKQWLQAVQNRTTATATLLTKIRGLRMLGQLSHIAKRIQHLREQEIVKAKAFLRVDALKNVCASTSTLLAPVATLLIFAFLVSDPLDGGFTSPTAFYALNLIALMSSPLALLLNTLPDFAASLACFERIQNFLEREERQDYRLAPEIGSAVGTTGLPGESVELLVVSPNKKVNTLSEHAYTATIDGGCFGYDTEERAILKDVNVHVVPGSFTVVKGPVGSGKSTLLKAFLAETRCFKGFVQLRVSSPAYCSQEVWLRNQTLRENILGNQQYNERFYNDVIFAVGLESDLAALSLGDRTVIGADTSSLSGGQARRVALARAVYARRPLLLLDDCLNGLDNTTRAKVMHRLFSRTGLLRKLGGTVIATSSTDEYNSEPDLFILLDQHGRTQSHPIPKTPADHELSNLMEQPWRMNGVQMLDPSDESCQNAGAEACPGQTTTVSPATDDRGQTDSKATDANSRVWRFYLGSMGWHHCATYLVLNALYVTCTRFSQVWVGEWVNASQERPGNHTNAVYGGSYAAIQIAAVLFFATVLLFIFQVMVPRSAQKLHWILLQTTVQARQQHHDETDTGVTLNRFSQDLTLVDIDLPSHAIEFVIDIFLCIGQAVIVALGIKYMAALLPAIVAVVYPIQRYYLRTSRQVRLLDLEAKSPLFSNILETASGLETIRAFGWSDRFTEHHHFLLDQSQRPFYALFCIQRWLGVVLALMVAVVAVCLVAFATQFRDLTTGNAIGVALLNVFSFSQTLMLLITAYTSLEMALGAIVRIKKYVADVKPEDDPSQELLDALPEPIEATAIDLDNITISYG
jgi:ABC-type multidrug transport system fused ATPase/permease subunit